MSKKRNKSLKVEELKNREKLLFFLNNPKFEQIKKDLIPIFAEFKKISEEDLRSFKDRALEIRDKIAEITEYIKEILRKNNLPIHFSKSIFSYFTEGKIESPMIGNFTIRVNPTVQISSDRIIKYADEVMLVTFAPLSTNEMRRAYKSLKRYWKLCFPPNVSKRTNLRDKDVDKKFLIEQAMQNRCQKAEYAEDKYLTTVKKDYGESAYKNAKKLHPRMTTEKVKKFTSNDVARKFYNTRKKAGAVRVMHSRIQKKFLQ